METGGAIFSLNLKDIAMSCAKISTAITIFGGY